MTKQLEINKETLSIGLEIVQCLSDLKPLSSLSFTLSNEGVDAVNEVLALVEWGIGKNAYKLKEAATEVFTDILEHPDGTPVNVNLTEYEIKAMEKVTDLIEKSLDKHTNGVLKK
jgi:hypothetical protein